MSILGNLAIFAGGALFSTVGVKLLTSEDAKKFYAYTAAAAIRAADSVRETASKICDECNDILEKAEEINKRYYEEKEKCGDDSDLWEDDWEDYDIDLTEDNEDSKYEDPEDPEDTEDDGETKDDGGDA